jgi:hypothetical protein
MIWLFNRIWFHLFYNKKDKLIFVYERTIESEYSSRTYLKYSTFLNIYNRLLKGKLTKTYIISKFNNIHYPIIDVDDPTQILPLIKSLNKMHIGFEIFQSSPGHYWVIMDMVFKNYWETNTLRRMLQNFGDQQYHTLCEESKHYPIRATYITIDRKPKLLNTSISDFDNPYVNKRETGAWRSPYYAKNMENRIITDALTEDFRKYINKLKDYYNDVQHMGAGVLSETAYGLFID